MGGENVWAKTRIITEFWKCRQRSNSIDALEAVRQCWNRSREINQTTPVVMLWRLRANGCTRGGIKVKATRGATSEQTVFLYFILSFFFITLIWRTDVHGGVFYFFSSIIFGAWGNDTWFERKERRRDFELGTFSNSYAQFQFVHASEKKTFN